MTAIVMLTWQKCWVAVVEQHCAPMNDCDMQNDLQYSTVYSVPQSMWIVAFELAARAGSLTHTVSKAGDLWLYTHRLAARLQRQGGNM